MSKPITLHNKINRKIKKNIEDRDLMIIGLISKFFLADIAFTLLPIVVIAILRAAFGTLDSSILFMPEWAFSAIIISSLALTRVLELKVLHQGDRSERVLVLSRICLLLIIFSVVCLALYTMKEQGQNVSESFVIKLQLWLLFFSGLLLWAAHYYRETLVSQMKNIPTNISPNTFHRLVCGNLKECKNNMQTLCSAFRKQYNFFKEEDGEFVKEDSYKMKYKNDQINRFIEDIENDLIQLKECKKAWKGVPYNRVAGGFSPPAPTPPQQAGLPKGTPAGRALGGSQNYRAVAGQ